MSIIYYRQGNLLSVTEGYIAHGVNCQGVMGSGVANAIRTKYPKVYETYNRTCEIHNSRSHSSALLGSMLICDTNGLYPGRAPLQIVNMFTQDFYGTDKRHVNYEAVAQCFENLTKYTSLVHIPKIGAGLGGGNWNVIETIIKEYYDGEVVVWVI